MSEKINITRFCDLQGVNDFDRAILEKMYRKDFYTYNNWYDMVKKGGFWIGDIKQFTSLSESKEPPATVATENKNKKNK